MARGVFVQGVFAGGLCPRVYVRGVFVWEVFILIPFFKEFRVVGQICREGMDESGILPNARYAMTVFISWSNWLSGGAL